MERRHQGKVRTVIERPFAGEQAAEPRSVSLTIADDVH
jgi:hypothetical protein